MISEKILACPICKIELYFLGEGNFECKECSSQYFSKAGITVFLKGELGAETIDRASFWNKGWEKRNARLLSLDYNAILLERNSYLDYLKKEGYPSVSFLSESQVSGKSFLNIGCGGGYEGLLFAGYGASNVGVDFSFNAVDFTKKLLEKAKFQGTTYQAEAEHLPFRDNSFDFVYSSGVLHHTPNTEKAIKEIFRVLKTGGQAVIGLYATFSIMFFWYRIHAVFRGNFSKRSIESWMHSNTEGDWKVENSENKWTKTYTKADFERMIKEASFGEVNIQQTQQQIKTLPILGKAAMLLLPKFVGDMKIGPFGSMLVATCVKSRSN